MQDTITNPPFNPIGSLRNENVERPGRQKMATESWDFLSLSALTRKIGQRKLRWLDTVFQGQYLPSLSINYVAINKVLEKLPPQLY